MFSLKSIQREKIKRGKNYKEKREKGEKREEIEKIKERFFHFIKPTQNPDIFRKDLKVKTFSFYFKIEKYFEFFSSLEPFFLPLDLRDAPIKRKSEFISSRMAVLFLVEKYFFKFHFFFDKKNWLQTLGRNFFLPKGLLGSITHSDSFVSVALSENEKLFNFGIDSQKVKEKWIKNKGLINSLKNKISSSSEISRNSNCKVLFDGLFLMLIFSAKESIYKCINRFGFLYQLKDMELDFRIHSLQGSLQDGKVCHHLLGRRQLLEQEDQEVKIQGIFEIRKMQGKMNPENKIQKMDKKGLMTEDIMNSVGVENKFQNEPQRDWRIGFLKEPWKFGSGEFEIEKDMIHTSFMLK